MNGASKECSGWWTAARALPALSRWPSGHLLSPPPMHASSSPTLPHLLHHPQPPSPSRQQTRQTPLMPVPVCFVPVREMLRGLPRASTSSPSTRKGRNPVPSFLHSLARSPNLASLHDGYVDDIFLAGILAKHPQSSSNESRCATYHIPQYKMTVPNAG
jgi:hypothetical protein